MNLRPGISSLRGQGHFHFAKGTSIGKPWSLWETCVGAPGPSSRATEAIGPCGLGAIPGLHNVKIGFQATHAKVNTRLEAFLLILSTPDEQIVNHEMKVKTPLLHKSKDYRAPKAQDAELNLYQLLEREIRMGAISASKCFVSHW